MFAISIFSFGLGSGTVRTLLNKVSSIGLPFWSHLYSRKTPGYILVEKSAVRFPCTLLFVVTLIPRIHMDFWRNTRMTGYWNNQSYMNRNGPPFPILANVDAVCKYCGKTFDFLIYHRCSATNAYCYKCRHLGHFARVCSLHNCESPVTKPRKRKSNSKIQRDKLRMEKFIERKRTKQFQFPI